MHDTNQQLRGGQLALWLAAELVPINFALTARIRGAFTAEQLRQALEKLQIKHPRLAMRTEKQSDGNVYLVPDAGLTIPVRRLERKHADSWIEEAAAELVQNFDMRRAPPLRLVWLEGSEFSDIIFVCPHTLADGLSTAYLTRDLLMFLSDPGRALEPLPLEPSLEALIPAFSGKRLVIWQAKLLSLIYKVLLRLRSKNARAITNPAAIDAEYRLLNWELTHEQTAALAARSRAENTTVHAALCAAFLRAFGELHGDGWRRVIKSPINLRNRLAAPVGESFGIFIGLTEFPVDCAPEHDLWELARKIKKCLVKQTRDKSIFAPLLAMCQFMDSMATVVTPSLLIQLVTRVKCDLSITNLGALAFPVQYGSLQLVALYGPSVSGKRNEINLGVNTVNKKMHLTLSFTEQKLTLAQAERIKNIAMRRLAEASNF